MNIKRTAAVSGFAIRMQVNSCYRLQLQFRIDFYSALANVFVFFTYLGNLACKLAAAPGWLSFK